jgi:uncharacterized protein YjbI with pentapeptide repeats
MPLLEPDADLDGLHLDSEDLTGQDGRGARLLDCTVTLGTLDDVRLDRAQIVDTALTGVGATALTMTEATLRDVTLTDCRLGGVQAYGSEWLRVTVRGGRLGYLNLRGATLREVRLDGCVVDDLDLAGATVRDLTIADTRVGRLDLTGARCTDVDLRGLDALRLERLDGPDGLAGTTIDTGQLAVLAPALAAHLRITVT